MKKPQELADSMARVDTMYDRSEVRKFIAAAIQAERDKHAAREKELGQQLEHDRTLVANCITKANSAIDSRHWLTEGRGPYEWNDDRWHDEFRDAGLEIKIALAPMKKIATDWSGCPMSVGEITQSRIDLRAQVKELRDALGKLLLISERFTLREDPEWDDVLEAHAVLAKTGTAENEKSA